MEGLCQDIATMLKDSGIALFFRITETVLPDGCQQPVAVSKQVEGLCIPFCE
jgi:hypothetical protein